MEGKTVKFSRMYIVQQMMPQDANLAGNVHGGVIMKLIDNSAGLAALRHCGANVVTASIDRLDFHNPVFVGDLLKIWTSLNFAGKSSMEVGVRVEAENPFTGETRHTASAYLTFVAMGREGTPTVVPPLILETEEDKKRHREATERRETRLLERTKKKTDRG